MNILIFSDGHGDQTKLEALTEEFKKADIVFFGGDAAKFGKISTGLPFIKTLASLHDEVFAVTGNCDEPSFIDVLEEYNMNVEKTLSYYNGLVMAGSGGGSKFTRLTPNERTDEELVSDLALVTKAATEEKTFWDNLILIMHNPPKNTKTDRTSAGMHVGSPLLREFIETYKPLLVVTGHIHEAASIDYIGESCVVNPGALADGFYATAELEGGGKNPFKIKSIELKSL